MRIRGNRLKELAAKAGVSVPQLAEAIVEPGVSAEDAFSAVKGAAHGAPSLPNEDAYFTQGD